MDRHAAGDEAGDPVPRPGARRDARQRQRAWGAGCRAGNWVFVQGQVGWTLDAKVVAVGDPAGRLGRPWRTSRRSWRWPGTLSDVVRFVVYVTDREVCRTTYPAIRQYVGDLWPCGTGVVVKGLAREEFLIEIDAYGFIDDPS